jgi:DNA repair and recombination RAD54-like protein
LHVGEDATTDPRQRKKKTGLDPADLSPGLQQTDISSEPDMPIEEEEEPKNGSDGLEEYWKDFALAVESTKVRVSTTEFGS